MTWGQFNRKALIRLPIVATDAAGRAVSAQTIEFRLPDGSAHPHLVLALVAQAMMTGRATADVAKTFADVAAALAAQRGALEAGDVFPQGLIDRVVATLEARKD